MQDFPFHFKYSILKYSIIKLAQMQKLSNVNSFQQVKQLLTKIHTWTSSCNNKIIIKIIILFFLIHFPIWYCNNIKIFVLYDCTYCCLYAFLKIKIDKLWNHMPLFAPIPCNIASIDRYVKKNPQNLHWTCSNSHHIKLSSIQKNLNDLSM